MTNRDKEDIRAVFAALAMNGLLSGQTNPHAEDKVERFIKTEGKISGCAQLTHAEDIARDAVAYADALLKALKHEDDRNS